MVSCQGQSEEEGIENKERYFQRCVSGILVGTSFSRENSPQVHYTTFQFCYENTNLVIQLS